MEEISNQAKVQETKASVLKVLVASPYSDRHNYVINEWLSNTHAYTYPSFDILLVDNSEKDDSYEWLKKRDSKKLTVLRHHWDKKYHVMQMLAHVREEIRHYAVEHNYDYLFFCDVDIITPIDIIEKLVALDKDNVGPPVSVFYAPNTKPCVLKDTRIYMDGKDSDSRNFYDWEEVFAHNEPFQAYGVGVGCLLIKRKCFETIPFRTHPDFVQGEDIWYFNECNDKGFEFWCDPRIEVLHKNAIWSDLPALNREMGWAMVFGQNDMFLQQGDDVE